MTEKKEMSQLARQLLGTQWRGDILHPTRV
jgi:hypothetical protein